MALKKSELYSSLWQSCDELRGGMDASQYKDYVLVLLFIKYISDKYSGSPFSPITIPEGSSFKDMVALKGRPDIGDKINTRIIAPLKEANKLSDLPDFNDATKLGSGKEMVERLSNLIGIFENKALDYEEYLKRIAELAKKVEVGIEDNTPEDLDTPAKRALYNNLVKIRTHENELSEGGAQDVATDLALKIDKVIREVRPDGWRGIRPRENVIKDALYSILGDVDEVEKLFLIIKEQNEY